jgi:hypothetical protein
MAKTGTSATATKAAPKKRKPIRIKPRYERAKTNAQKILEAICTEHARGNPKADKQRVRAVTGILDKKIWDTTCAILKNKKGSIHYDKKTMELTCLGREEVGPEALATSNGILHDIIRKKFKKQRPRDIFDILVADGQAYSKEELANKLGLQNNKSFGTYLSALSKYTDKNDGKYSLKPEVFPFGRPYVANLANLAGLKANDESDDEASNHSSSCVSMPILEGKEKNEGAYSLNEEVFRFGNPNVANLAGLKASESDDEAAKHVSFSMEMPTLEGTKKNKGTDSLKEDVFRFSHPNVNLAGLKANDSDDEAAKLFFSSMSMRILEGTEKNEGNYSLNEEVFRIGQPNVANLAGLKANENYEAANHLFFSMPMASLQGLN